MQGHYAILSCLYELYRSNSANNDALEKIAKIATTLESDFKFDQYGYRELAELCTMHSSQNATTHYVAIIEENLLRLRQEQESNAY